MQYGGGVKLLDREQKTMQNILQVTRVTEVGKATDGGVETVPGTHGGSSGAPLFNAKGQLMGLHYR